MKKSASTGTISGCIIWIIVFAVFSACLLPVAVFIGGFTSGSNLAARVVGKWECPRSTTPEIYSYETMSTDDNGFPTPATAYELHCVDTSGTVIKNDPVAFAFIWEGIAAGAGLVLAVVLAFALAAPAGVLVGRLFNKEKKS